MGACSSSPAILKKNNCDKAAYEARFKEDKVLGQGEFGVVKLVYEKTGEEAPLKAYACENVRKGTIFKDNTLYAALPPEILMGEIDMLRTFNGEHYCMKLVAIYETPKSLLMVTDCYTGGEMMEYILKQSRRSGFLH
jgi:serine/threonine protein kinase